MKQSKRAATYAVADALANCNARHAQHTVSTASNNWQEAKRTGDVGLSVGESRHLGLAQRNVEQVADLSGQRLVRVACNRHDKCQNGWRRDKLQNAHQ